MVVRHPNQSDWERFLSLASAENWRVPQTELRLFKGLWSQSAHVLDDGKFCGLVTAVAYEKSAWIGNLIVPHNLRGKGYGSSLFKTVLADLVGGQMTSVWLTASDQGRTIYEKEGFVVVDCVERWVLSPASGAFGNQDGVDNPCEKLLRADRLAWGESRKTLLSVLFNFGKIFAAEGAIALLQTGPDLQIIGPWYSHNASLHSNQILLQKLIAAADPSVDIVIDLLASSPIQTLCESVGFKCTGQATLMVYGDRGSINLKSMMSLASLGSLG